MLLNLPHQLQHYTLCPTSKLLPSPPPNDYSSAFPAALKPKSGAPNRTRQRPILSISLRRNPSQRSSRPASISASLSQLDLTEDNIKQVLVDARTELAQLFDTSVNITGKAELAELDGPYVKISLSGRFWHKRSTVLARLGNYLKQRIPEILEVDIEDEKQLDDSPENF